MRSRMTGVGAAIVLAVALVVPANAVLAAEYPSWDEVEAAKADVASREAEAARITALVDELEAESGRLGDAAVEAAAVSAAAETARIAAEARATTLRAASDDAVEEAAAAGAQLGRAGAVLARSGGADVTLRLLFDGGEDDLLVGLSRAAQLANVYGGVAARARAARADAAALSAQADVAEAERTRLAGEAAAAADAAQAAHVAAEARVAEQRATLDTLYAQLASLRDRSVELERQFRIGEEAAREQAAREQAAREAAAAAASSGGGGDDGGAPPPGVVVDRDAAKAYAASRMAAYGWGSEQFRCLDLLWTRESGWRADAYNWSSGAYGIPQSLPGSKMASAGSDWRTNAATQVDWGLSYISARYGTPCAAWAHSEAVNWY
ncbi:hypothetical protein [Agromyces sp. H66]|uniref:aggregation-promoting factor C-terminal-like domain-containing protein n=1 Tax=Agromyces sp. H66 TaxID=2529859 RepID=UPI0010A9BE52|nr:hypothetical protein [Agromyces sp. H66]